MELGLSNGVASIVLEAHAGLDVKAVQEISRAQALGTRALELRQ